MSLTAQPTWVVTTDSPSPSAPPPTSEPPKHDNSHLSPTSSILFSFLIVFLSVFAIFIFGGVISHHIMVRRRHLIRMQLEDMNQKRLTKRRPMMWDIWAGNYEHEEAPQKWEDFNPLSTQFAISPKDRANAEETVSPLLGSLTAKLFIELLRDTVMRRPLQSTVFNSIDSNAKIPLPPSLPLPVPGTGVEVAILLAMPSQRNHARDDSSISKIPESEQLGEYVIGTIRTCMGHQGRDSKHATSP